MQRKSQKKCKVMDFEKFIVEYEKNKNDEHIEKW